MGFPGDCSASVVRRILDFRQTPLEVYEKMLLGKICGVYMRVILESGERCGECC